MRVASSGGSAHQRYPWMAVGAVGNQYSSVDRSIFSPDLPQCIHSVADLKDFTGAGRCLNFAVRDRVCDVDSWLKCDRILPQMSC
jgi:hypothetical protein